MENISLDTAENLANFVEKHGITTALSVIGIIVVLYLGHKIVTAIERRQQSSENLNSTIAESYMESNDRLREAVDELRRSNDVQEIKIDKVEKLATKAAELANNAYETTKSLGLKVTCLEEKIDEQSTCDLHEPDREL